MIEPTDLFPLPDPPDFSRVFHLVTAPLLVMRADAPAYTVVEANAAYLAASGARCEALVGRGLFEVFFPEGDPLASQPSETARNLRASLDRVLATRAPDLMPVQRYDQTAADGALEETYWIPTNSPVIDAAGRLTHIIHHVQNVTAVVRPAEDRSVREVLLAQEQHSRTLAEAIPQLAWIAEPGGFIFWYNQRWYDYTGTTPEQMTGWGWQSVHDPAHLPRVLERWRASIRTGEPFDMEFPLRGADGRFRWFLTRVMPLKDADGQVVRWFGTNTDVDERRAAALALQERQERLEAALKASGTGTFRWDIRTNALDCDDSLDALFGLAPGAAVRSLDQFIARVHPEDRARVIAACRRCSEAGADFDEQFRVVWPDGTVRWLGDTGKTIHDADGVPSYMTGACVDITDRVVREAALEERVRLAAFTGDVGVALTQSDTLAGMLHGCCEAMVRHLEAAFARIWTLDAAANVLVLQASAGLYTNLDGSHARVPVGRFKIGRIAEERRPHLTNDVLRDEQVSDPAWAAREGMVAFAGFPLVVGERLVGVMALFARRTLTDATLQAMEAVAHSVALGLERRQADVGRQASELRYRSLVEATTQVVWVCDGEGRLTTEQPSWSAFTGQAFAEYREFGWSAAVHPEDRDALLAAWRRAVAEGHFPGTEARIRRHDGVYRRFWIRGVALTNAAGAIEEWVGACSDITDRVLAEQQLRNAERMQAVGTLAGGVAHEINNQMTAALGFSSFVLRALGPDHPQAGDLRVVLQAAGRAARISQQLLAFSRQQVTLPRALDLREVVHELEPVLQQLLGSDKALVFRLSLGEGRVHADPEQVQQVLINLVANARDATDTGTEILLTLDEIAVESEVPGPLGEPVVPGRYVRLTVTDRGHGMDAATLDRVFDPFFTTKEVGHGTGLGLAMVYGIMRRHGGYVVARSRPGAGTSMELYWPVVSSDCPAMGPPAPAPGPARAPDDALVLVVEDEAMVRGLAVRILEEEGYTVVAAEDGAAALEALARGVVRPALVVTDVVMPRMNGRQLRDAIGERWPEVPVLFMSGHTGKGDVLQRLLPPGAPFLQKPFTPEALARAVGALCGTDGTQAME